MNCLIWGGRLPGVVACQGLLVSESVEASRISRRISLLQSRGVVAMQEGCGIGQDCDGSSHGQFHG